MSSFAIFRLPFAETCTLMVQEEGEPEELHRLSSLNDRQGYVFAPFAVSPKQPILLLSPTHVETMDCKEVVTVCSSGILADYAFPCQVIPSPLSSHYQMRYHLDFCNFYAQLHEGTFRKIVLSRCLDLDVAEPESPFMLFQKACERYPRMFISLVSTLQGGTWLTATPEILLESCTPESLPQGEVGGGSSFRTIALAGTVPFTEEVRWSEKNIREQRYVATYMMETLEQFTNKISEEGPYTTRAANLAHLRSDFTFTLSDNHHLGTLLQTLHPTPAVCGIPKREAFDFILRNESSPRRYYSGFQGPLQPEGETHLYVSLRCMMINGGHYALYAGGGLLKDSIEESEWQETEAKLNTMRNVLE
jgi:isochorismate synthase